MNKKQAIERLKITLEKLRELHEKDHTAGLQSVNYYDLCNVLDIILAIAEDPNDKKL